LRRTLGLAVEAGEPVLLGFRDRIEVLAPEVLRAELKASAARIAGLYVASGRSDRTPA